MPEQIISLVAAFLSGGGLVSLVNALFSAQQDKTRARLQAMDEQYEALLNGAWLLYDQVIELNGVPNYKPPEERKAL